jgi:hypothetical protein
MRLTSTPDKTVEQQMTELADEALASGDPGKGMWGRAMKGVGIPGAVLCNPIISVDGSFAQEGKFILHCLQILQDAFVKSADDNAQPPQG